MNISIHSIYQRLVLGGHIGKRENKRFECPNGHVDRGDVNASFNMGNQYCIASYCPKDQSNLERDTLESSTDTLKGATLEKTIETLEPLRL